MNRDESLAYLRQPMAWPRRANGMRARTITAVIRVTDKGSETGTVFNVPHRPLTTVYSAGMFDIGHCMVLAGFTGPVEGVTEYAYPSLEALVDDGWRVD